MNTIRFLVAAVSLGLWLPARVLLAQTESEVKARYSKSEYRIPMRDGTHLFTSVYVPRDTSQSYPVLLTRTPYSVAPYGADQYKTSLGPSLLFQNEGYIFAYQDVRGRFMSEGEFELMTPYREQKKTPQEVDEASDTYDTIEWLVKNVPHNNGRAGVWGISFPGFYAAMASLAGHPALKAVSPQAPMADIFIGDDFHHNGAFFLPHAFGFLNVFRRERPGTEQSWRPGRVSVDSPDGYRYFLDLGSVANVNAKLFHDSLALWNQLMEHGTYDAYWKERNVPRHLKNIKPATMVVGGLFDSEDLYGPCAIYHAIEQNAPSVRPTLVLGPWPHGGWARIDGDSLGLVRFGAKTSLWYREHVELPFFDFYLKDKGTLNLPAVLVFLTGRNEWRSYDAWPPKDAAPATLYFHANGRLSFSVPTGTGDAVDQYVSDPAKPVPFTQHVTTSMGTLFMVEDQRSVSTRPDVVWYETEPLSEEVTVVGPPVADLTVSTSGTDCDWIVKLIDVYPDTASDNQPMPWGMHLGGMQQLVRYEVMRSKFRNSLEYPEPMPPNTPTRISYALRDVSHTFLRGHRIMVQIQSTWFPLIDRNPGIFTDIYHAADSDFHPTVQRIYRSASRPSGLKVLIIK